MGSNNLTIDAQSLGSVILVTPHTSATITDLTLINGGGSIGSGLVNYGTTTIERCTLLDNTATVSGGGGGGIANMPGAILTVEDCTIADNSAEYGGGIFNGNDATATIESSTIVGNTCFSTGAGAYNDDGQLQFTSSTIAQNEGGVNGDGINGYSDSTSIVLTDTIVADNTSNVNSADNLGGATTYTGNNNLIGESQGSLADPSNLSGDPSLAPLGYYGGPTQTMPLLPGSLGLGAGEVFTGPHQWPLPSDQRGFRIPLCSAQDIGSVQTQSTAATGVNPLYVTTLSSDPVDVGQLSFQDAVNLDDAMGGGQTISFKASLLDQSGGSATLGSLFSVTGPESINENDTATVNFDSSSALDVTSWNTVWFDQSGNPVGTLSTSDGSSGSASIDDVQSAGLVATITAVESSGESIRFPSFVVDVVPLPPTDAAASVISPNQIDLTWSDSTAVATNYDILESIDGDWIPLDSVPAGTCVYDATGLTSDTSYDFEVAADDGTETSAVDSATATTATPPILTISNVTSVNEGCTYTLTLGANSSAGNANTVQGWEVDLGDDQLHDYTGASQIINYTVQGGWSGLAIVATAQTVGTSTVPSYSVQADPIYVDVVPTEPTLTSVVVNSATDATITWQDNSSCDNSIVLLRSSGGAFSPVMTFAPGGTGSYDDTSLSPSTTYQYEMEALGGLTGQVASGLATSSPVTTQSSEFGLTVTPDDFNADSGNIDVAWTYAGNDVATWELESGDTSVGRNDDWTSYDPSARKATVGAVTGDTYLIKLRADYTDGLVSDWDQQSITLTPTLFPTVQAVPYTSSGGQHSIHVSWTMPSGVDPSQYNVSIQYKGSTTTGDGWEGLDTGDAADGWQYGGTDAYANINIGDGESAEFRVEVVGLLSGGYSTGVSAAQGGVAGPAPSVTLQENSDGGVTATWTAVQNANGYYVFFADHQYDGEPQEAGNTFASPPEFTSGYTASCPAGPGDHMYVEVEALDSGNSNGYGGADCQVTGAPLPGSPRNLVATLTSPNTVALHWNDYSYDETGFDVYRSDDPTFATDVAKITTTSTDGNEYTDTLPNEITTYYYRVFGYSSVAASGDEADGDDSLLDEQYAIGQSLTDTSGQQGGLALQSVHFTGGGVAVGSSWEQTYGAPQSIERDDSSGIYPLDKPQWLDDALIRTADDLGTSTYLDGTIAPTNFGAVDPTADHSWPISYERSLPNHSAYMDATPSFRFFGIAASGWEIKGTSSDGGSQSFTFGPGKAVQDGMTLYANLSCNQPLPTTIDSQSLTITWKISVDGGTTWSTVPVGVSKNHLYVTGASAQGAFQTVLWLGTQGAPTGCRPHDPNEVNVPNATWPNGEANAKDQQVVDAVWTNFSGNSTYRVDDTLMHYSLDGDNVNPLNDAATTLSGILRQPQGKGQCWAWSDLLIASLGINGVVAKHLSLDPPVNATGFGVLPRPAQGTGGADFEGGTRAAGGFSYHMIVYVPCYPNKVYDPSYGSTTSGSSLRDAELHYESSYIPWIHWIIGWAADVPGDIRFTLD